MLLSSGLRQSTARFRSSSTWACGSGWPLWMAAYLWAPR